MYRSVSAPCEVQFDALSLARREYAGFVLSGDAAFLACTRCHGVATSRSAWIPVHVRGEQLALRNISPAVWNGRGT